MGHANAILFLKGNSHVTTKWRSKLVLNVVRAGMNNQTWTCIGVISGHYTVI